jgi:hypothetical protein
MLVPNDKAKILYPVLLKEYNALPNPGNPGVVEYLRFRNADCGFRILNARHV